MTKELIKRIDDWNKIKYPNDKETRIIFLTLKPEGLTTAPNIKDATVKSICLIRNVKIKLICYQVVC